MFFCTDGVIWVKKPKYDKKTNVKQNWYQTLQSADVCKHLISSLLLSFLSSVDFCHMVFFAAWQKTKQRRFAACCDGRNWAELLEEQTPGVPSGSDLIRRRVQTGWQIRDDFLLLSSLNPPLVALTADSLQRFPVYQFSRVVVTLSKLVDFLCAALSLCIDTQQSWDYYAVYISGSFCVGW